MILRIISVCCCCALIVSGVAADSGVNVCLAPQCAVDALMSTAAQAETPALPPDALAAAHDCLRQHRARGRSASARATCKPRR